MSTLDGLMSTWDGLMSSTAENINLIRLLENDRKINGDNTTRKRYRINIPTPKKSSPFNLP